MIQRDFKIEVFEIVLSGALYLDCLCFHGKLEGSSFEI
jgi:hypothetical protein